MARPRKRFNRGQWQVQRERFQLESEKPGPAEYDATRSIADLVPVWMKKWGLDARFWERQLMEEWPSLVGAQVASHSRPGTIENRVLAIFVKHPIWLSELSRYGQKQILANLQARFGADRIAKIRLQLDPDGGRTP